MEWPLFSPLVISAVAGFVGIGIGWGMQRQKMVDIDRRLGVIEKTLPTFKTILEYNKGIITIERDFVAFARELQDLRKETQIQFLAIREFMGRMQGHLNNIPKKP